MKCSVRYFRDIGRIHFAQAEYDTVNRVCVCCQCQMSLVIIFYFEITSQMGDVMAAEYLFIFARKITWRELPSSKILPRCRYLFSKTKKSVALSFRASKSYTDPDALLKPDRISAILPFSPVHLIFIFTKQMVVTNFLRGRLGFVNLLLTMSS